MPNHGFQAAALKTLQQHAGLSMHYSDIAAETSFTARQISQALPALAQKPELGVIRVAAGTYRYSPNNIARPEDQDPLTPGELIEVVGRSGDLHIGRLNSGELVTIELLEIQ